MKKAEKGCHHCGRRAYSTDISGRLICNPGFGCRAEAAPDPRWTYDRDFAAAMADYIDE